MMKKIFSFLVLLYLCVTALDAQNNRQLIVKNRCLGVLLNSVSKNSIDYNSLAIDGIPKYREIKSSEYISFYQWRPQLSIITMNSVSRTMFVKLVNISSLWQSWWLIIILIIIFVVLVVLIVRMLCVHRKLQLQLQKQEQENKQNEVQVQCLFNLSQEILTPLTLIINPLKEIMRKSESNEGFVTENYKTIYRNSLRILRQINQILDLYNIRNGQLTMRFVHTDIKHFIVNISQSFSNIAEKRNIAIEVCCLMDDLFADIDIDNFEKVLYSIYINALEYTDDSSQIRTIIKEEGENVVISITDNKLKIDISQFVQIINSSSQDGIKLLSSNIGAIRDFYIAQKLILQHGGEINVSRNSDEEYSIALTIVIPRKHNNVVELFEEEYKMTHAEQNDICAVALKGALRYKASSNKCVLIVGNESEMLAYLVDELSKQYKVTTCSSGKMAYSLILKQKFDALISDINIQQFNGFDLCRKVKYNANVNHIPIIILTNKNSDDDRNNSMLSGADACIAKPFDIDILRNTLANILLNRDRVILRMTSAIEQSKVEMKSSDDILLEKVKKFVDEHLSEPSLNVEAVAEYVGMSRVHLHRKLKELMGQSTSDYIRTLRLRNAGVLLKGKKLNISEVAYALGFTNLSHFCNLFREFYGMSPKEYMNQHLKRK